MQTLNSIKHVLLNLFVVIVLVSISGCGPYRANMHSYMTNANCDIKVLNELPGGKGTFLENTFIEFDPPLDVVIKDYMCGTAANNLDHKNLTVMLRQAKMQLIAGGDILSDMVSTIDAQYIYKHDGKSIIQGISVHRVVKENGLTGKRDADVNFFELIKQLDIKIKDSLDTQISHS